LAAFAEPPEVPKHVIDDSRLIERWSFGTLDICCTLFSIKSTCNPIHPAVEEDFVADC
jgi:hypothetical protein